MREYRRIRNGVAIFLAAYFTGGLLTPLLPQMEVFPVYSWFLFSLVPQAGTQYGLLITDANGNRLDPPRLYQNADGAVNKPHAETAFKLIQKLGAALDHNASDANNFRSLLERDWLPPKTHYEVVVIDADPVARWKHGDYEIIRYLKAYTTPEAAR